MTTLTIPNAFSAGQTLVSALMNANFSAVSSVLNGNLDSGNLAAGAVTYAKLGTDARTAAGTFVGTGTGDYVFSTDTASYFYLAVSLTTSGLRPVMVQADVAAYPASAGILTATIVYDGVTELARTSSTWTGVNEQSITSHGTLITPTAATHTFGFRVYSSGPTFNVVNNAGRVPRLTVCEL